MSPCMLCAPGEPGGPCSDPPLWGLPLAAQRGEGERSLEAQVGGSHIQRSVPSHRSARGAGSQPRRAALSPGAAGRTLQESPFPRGDHLRRDCRKDESGRVELQSPDPHLCSGVSRPCPFCSGEGPACDPQPERHEIGCSKGKSGDEGGDPVPAELPLPLPRSLCGAGSLCLSSLSPAPGRRLPEAAWFLFPHSPRCSWGCPGGGTGGTGLPLSSKIPHPPPEWLPEWECQASSSSSNIVKRRKGGMEGEVPRCLPSFLPGLLRSRAQALSAFSICQLKNQKIQGKCMKR
ncbi:uncharacterized protein LOC127390244 [Apus apus]|uniref:uncharacterized protein LOC127390244 n=1 Tax=Apus apus TaxID=8895 RepID=UPI0021F91071|nr:uncharacterized protein LOC127390244 [Apus apus]